jgi:hypothetical protein
MWRRSSALLGVTSLTNQFNFFTKEPSSQFSLYWLDLKYIALYLVLPNFAFFVIGRFAFLDRPIAIIDYALLCVISPFISRRTLLFLFSITFIFDVGFALAPAYHLQGADFAHNAYAVFLMSQSVIFAIFFFILSVVFLFYLFLSNYFSASSCATFRNLKIVFVAVFLLISIDVANGSNIFIPSKFNLLPWNIAGSNIHKIFLAGRNIETSGENKLMLRATNINSGTSNLLGALTSGDRPLADKILVVVVESYGVQVSNRLQQLFNVPFNRELLKSRYAVRYGEVPFFGSTVSGEVRELCGVRISSPSDVDNISMTECLPNLLKLQGYNTTAVHGFSRYMFDRQSWYPRVGFDTMLFADELSAEQYQNHCGHVFRGSCDSDVAIRVQRLLSQKSVQGGDNRQFVYWLTLNSHLPVARDTSIERDIDCSSVSGVDDRDLHEEVCRLNRVLLGTLHLIADIAEQTEGNLHVVIVGDHAPPFVWQKDRNMFKGGVVPFVELLPREMGR